MTNNKITVLGSTGTIGSELVNLLSMDKISTNVVYRSSAKIRTLPFIHWVKADINDIESLKPVLMESERLFLLTGNKPGFGETQINIIKAAEQYGVKHIVKLSALGATPRTKSPLLLEHWEAEQALENTKLTWTMLRPHAFMQNWLTDIAPTVKKEKKIYSAVGDGRVPFIDARDIAAVAKESLLYPEKHHGKHYVLTGGTAIGYKDLAEALSKATQQNIVYHALSMEEMRERMEKQGVLKEMIDSYLALSFYQKAGGATERVSDDVKNILNKDPRTVFEFARDYKEAFV